MEAWRLRHKLTQVKSTTGVCYLCQRCLDGLSTDNSDGEYTPRHLCWTCIEAIRNGADIAKLVKDDGDEAP